MQSSDFESIEDADLFFFDNQISGHSCLLKGSAAPHYVYKPYDCNESDFYEHVSQEKDHPLSTFIPPYYGIHQISKQKLEGVVNPGFNEEHSSIDSEGSTDCMNSVAETNHNSYSDSPGNLSGSKEDWFKNLFQKRFNDNDTRFVKLQDLTSTMENPCILDLKMGSIAYNPKKLMHQIAKFGKTTSASLKFRICGLQVKNSKDDTSYFRDKYWGRKIDTSLIKSALALFFSDGLVLRRNIIKPFIWKLQELASAIKSCTGYKFYSVSLLLIYDSSIEEEKFDTVKEYQLHMKDKIKVNLIDFAKTVREKSVTVPDIDLLTGLENLITCLTLIDEDPELKPFIA